MQILNVVSQLIQHAIKRWEARRLPVDCFCVHHSATAATVTLEAIARYHVLTKDMPGIQYHYVIGADGAIYQTQPDELFVWHGNDWNTGLGVCLLGDFTLEHPTPAQIESTRWLLAKKRQEYGAISLVGHKEAPNANTSCPGDTWEQWKERLEGMKRILTFHIESAAELNTEPTTTLRNSKLPWLKAINPHTWATPMRDTFPNQKVVARLHGGGDAWDEQEHEWMRQGEAGAKLYLAHFAGAIEKCIAEGVAMFEGPNEVHPNGRDNPWSPFVDFQWALATHYADLGIPYAALSLGTGWMPNIDDIVQFKGVLQYAAAHGGGLAFHEYGCPSWLSGNGFWTLRIRKTFDALYAAGVPQMSIPAYGTEHGITWALLGYDDTGFRSHSSYVYPAEYGLASGVMTEERFLLQAQGYEEAIVAQVPEVQMLAMFGLLPYPSWKTFSITTDMVKWVVAREGYEEIEEPVDVEAAIVAAIQAHIIPLNPDAALEKAGAALGLLPASDEVRDVAGYVAQAFRKAGDEGTQHIAYCADGDWGNVKWLDHAN